jgi:hypothetical protein
MEKQKMVFRDPIIKKVVNKFVDRSDVGYEKYKITLNDDNSDLDTWMNHLQEELMDAVLYLQKAKEAYTEDMQEELLKDSKKNG